MIQHEDRICIEHERNEHIELACKEHPHLRWGTKNISHIGARSFFFNLFNGGHYSQVAEGVIECPCSANLLFHVCKNKTEEVLCAHCGGVLGEVPQPEFVILDLDKQICKPCKTYASKQQLIPLHKSKKGK